MASVGLVRGGFGMRWWPTLRGSWLVLRANQRWAPVPDNDPEGARRTMARFYRVVAAASGEPLDADRAAELEVGWWRAHREAQRGDPSDRAVRQAALVDALTALYAFVYRVPDDEVRPAAVLRAEAMDVSDRWVAAGCDADSDLLADEERLLVRSYASLLAAVHR
ncbi:MAG TPA: hypothetical protein VFJ85_03300 [Acidimicrobiales bacterium]|nr:hypothetical protein [Acidimicrobiales bacterium]